MKLNTRLNLVAVCTAVGLLILIASALRILYVGMLEDRRNQIELTVTLATNQIHTFIAQEKSGVLTRAEAQQRAKETLAQLRKGDDYIFVRTSMAACWSTPMPNAWVKSTSACRTKTEIRSISGT